MSELLDNLAKGYKLLIPGWPHLIVFILILTLWTIAYDAIFCRCAPIG
jgi:hypothetical protein